MTLSQFLNSLSPQRRIEVAAKCGTSFEYLRQIGYGNRPCSPKIAVSLERESLGVITRKTLFPDDWPHVWPELMQAEQHTLERGGYSLPAESQI